MYHIKSLIAALAFACGLSAQGAEEPFYITFSYADGTKAQIEVPFPEEGAELPTMKFTEKSIEITIPSESTGEAPKVHSVEIKDLESSNIGGTSSIQNTVLDNSIVITPFGTDAVRIASPETVSAEEILLYDLNGRKLDVMAEISGNIAVVSLDRLPAGIYVINYRSKTIKVVTK